MESVLPMLAVRTDVPSLIEVNGNLCGEASEFGHVALPLSDTGDYYVCAIPLKDTPEARRFAVTRKLSFVKGELKPPEAADVKICAWPGGVYELDLSPGTLPHRESNAFPYSIAHIDWREGDRERRFTLYHEGGLRLSIEEGERFFAGYALGEGSRGELSLLDVGAARALIVTLSAEPGERLLAFGFDGELLLDLFADAAGIFEGCPYIIRRYSTLLQHECRQRYDYRDGAFFLLAEEMGFFTREKTVPVGEREFAIAFCEAVREGWKEEAWSYLEPNLAAELDFSEVREFIGAFSCCRTPFSDDSGKLLGLIHQSGERIDYAQLLRFEFENGRISNISEE